MKYFKQILRDAGLILLGTLLATSVVYAATILFPSGGGTGQGTLPASQLIYGNGLAPVGSVATGTVTCLGTVSCGAGSYVVGSNLTITGVGGGGSGSGTVSTTTPLVSGQVDFSTGVSTIGNDSTFLFDTTFKRLTFNYSTSTYSSFITASSTNFTGGGLATCTTNNFLQYTASGFFSCGAGNAFPFTVFTNYNATDTPIAFRQGFFSTASSTISGNLFLTSAFANGLLYTGTNGLVQTTATTSVTAGSGISFTTFTALGSSPITIACTGCSGASVPNVTYTTIGGTRFYTASSTATDNLAWLFGSGFTTQSSTTVGYLNAVGITSTSTFSNAVNIVAGQNTGNSSLLPAEGALNVTCTNSIGLCGQFYRNIGSTAVAPIVLIRDNNSAVTQGVLELLTSGTNGGAYNLKNIGPVPQIEWVENDQVAPAGKFEDGVNGDIRYIASRNSGDTGFENAFTFDRFANGGMFKQLGTGASFFTGRLDLNGNASTTQFSSFYKSYFGATATTTIDSTGNISIPNNSGIYYGSNLVVFGDGSKLQIRPSGNNGEIQLADFGGNVLNTVLTASGFTSVSSTSPGSLFAIGGQGVGINFSLATTTYSTTGGINLTKGGCFAINGTCIGGGSGSGVTAVTGTWPIISSGGNTPNLTFGGLSTTTPLTTGRVPYISGVNTFADVATSSIANGVGITVTNGATAFVLGAQPSIACNTASLTVFGCLGTGDFSRFNSATTTFSTGLTYTLATNAVTVNTTQNITTLSNLSTAGSVNTTASGVLYSTGTSTPGTTAPIGYTGTLGQFINGVSGNFTCTSASTSVTGCLTSGDWNIFNNKANSKWATSTDGYIVFPTGQMAAIGTSTARIFPLTIASSTVPQLSLGDGKAGDAQVTFRNAGGNLYISTTTAQGLSTTTPPAFAIMSNGVIGIGTTTPTCNNANGPCIDISGSAPAITLTETASTRCLGEAVVISGSFYFGTGSNCGVGFLANGTVVGGFDVLGNGYFFGRGLFATSTGQSPIAGFSTTQRQLELSSGAGQVLWTQRNSYGTFYLATTTTQGAATSTTASFSIAASSGVISFGNYPNCTGTNALQVSATSIVCGSTVSDARLKKDFKDITPEEGIAVVRALQPKTFWFSDTTYHNTLDVRQQQGFVAQDILKLVKDHPALASAVGLDDHGYLTLDKTMLTPYFDAAIKYLDNQQKSSGGTNDWKLYLLAGAVVAYIVWNEIDKRLLIKK